MFLVAKGHFSLKNIISYQPQLANLKFIASSYLQRKYKLEKGI